MKRLILFLIATTSFAQVPESTPVSEAQEIQTRIRAMESLKPEDYTQNVESLRVELDRYFENKKRVCNGEYSTMVLGDVSESVRTEETRKLSKEERKVCFREMKNLQVSYINAVYEARRKYTLWLQEKQLEELAKVRDEAVKRLQTNFARYLD